MEETYEVCEDELDNHLVSNEDTTCLKESGNVKTERITGGDEEPSQGHCHSFTLRRCPPLFVSYCSRMKRHWIYVELIDLLKLSIPLLLSLTFQQTLLFISLIFVGSISNNESLLLDSAALSITVVNVTGISIGVGLATAADTLCSQTYGYKNYKRVGIIFQRGLLILLLTTLFIWCVWLNTESLLLLLQQPPCVARYAGHYVQIYSLCLPGIFLYLMMQKYLQSQGVVWPFIIVGLLANIFSPILHAIFLYAIPLGINGAAISLVLTNYFQPLILFVYMRVRKLHKQTWGGWSWESLKEWGQFYKYGLPGVAMVCMEWISFEISALVLGSLGEVELAINTVLINSITVLFMIPLGISISATIRVGNELGAGNPVRAKRASYVSIGLIVVIVLILSIILNSIGGKVGKIYNVEEAVMERLPILVHLLSGLLITDHIQGVISGIIRGAGHQLWGAAINLIAYYIVALPIGISLSLATNLKSLGMWIGLACGSVVQFSGYCICMCVLNWKKESELAMKRAVSSTGPPPIQEEEEEAEVDNVVLKTFSPLRQDEESTQEEEMVISNNPVSQNEDDYEQNSLEVNEEMKHLVTNDSKESILEITTHISLPQFKSHMKLLITRGGLYLIGAMCCIIAGITSMYHPPESIINGNYSECISDVYFNSSKW